MSLPGNKKRARIKLAIHGKTPEQKIEEQELQSQKIIDYPGVDVDVLAKNTTVNNDKTALEGSIDVRNVKENEYHVSVKEVTRKERTFDTDRTALVDKIETTYNYDQKVYEAMGFESYLEGPGEGISELGQVTNVKATPLTKGSFKIAFKGVDGDPTYIYFYTTGDPDDDASYKFLGNSTKVSKVFTNQPSEVKMWLKVKATKDDFEDGAWSNPVRIVVP